MTKHPIVRASARIAALLLTTASAAAMAQDAAPAREAPSSVFGEEIVVTAQKRAQNIQESAFRSPRSVATS